MEEYKLLKQISKGSFGDVYLVTKKERFYTLKIVPVKDEDMETIYREANILSALSDRYVIHYYEAWATKKQLIIVTEYCPHGDLGNIIKIAKTHNFMLNERTILRYFLHILYALDYVHSKGIIHRDIKPPNILISSGNECILSDFGLSKIVDISTNTQVGSPIYCAPELLNAQPYNKSVDIWALGCVLYEMCTLQLAFNAENMPDLLNLVKVAHPTISNLYRKDIQGIIDEMINVESIKRPTASEILSKPIMKETAILEIENLDPIPIYYEIRNGHRRDIEYQEIKSFLHPRN